MPNYEKYYKNKDFKARLLKYSILESTDAWSVTERQQNHMNKQILKLMDEQLQRDPFQGLIVKDMYRIQSVCTLKVPIDFVLEDT